MFSLVDSAMSILFLLLFLVARRALTLTPDLDSEHSRLESELHSRLDSYSKASGDAVDITLLGDAKALGAVCLDGSAPAYHWRPGFGSGAKNWHIHLEGGGWCESLSSCALRASTSHGSSKFMSNQLLFEGILSNKFSVNPDFYNWNHVYVRYCDGSSFSGDVPAPAKLSSGQVLYFRGKRIFKAIVWNLKARGLSSANQVLFSGCSAGGLAVLHRCNELQSFLPGVRLKCLSDAGFFTNAPNTRGVYDMYNYFKGVVNVHKLQNTLPSSCGDAVKCFFPQNAQAFVQVPMFFVNSAYDYWQLENVKEITPQQYRSCMSSSVCAQVKQLQDFRKSLLNGLFNAQSKPAWGSFIDSCFSHCQVEKDDKWMQQKVGGKSIAQALGDWYFARSTNLHHIDCSYPSCNPTCVSPIGS